MQRTNMSIAVVCMVNNTANQRHEFTYYNHSINSKTHNCAVNQANKTLKVPCTV